MVSKEELIKKLYANQCSKKELKLLFKLLQNDTSDAGSAVMLELLQKMQKTPDLDKVTADRIMNKVLEKTNNLNNNPIEVRPPMTIKKRFVWVKYAAAVLVLLAASWFALDLANDNALMLAETSFGKQETIELPDGSLVTLNANSSLTFLKRWDSRENRQVWLQGEAFFEVQKKPITNQKFQVITKDLTIEVLGTQFNVNSHQQQTKVFLEEGKVNLKMDGLDKGMLMSPGEMVAYSKKEKTVPIKRQLGTTNYPSWKNGIILFKNATLKEVFEKFEEIYGVSIQLENTQDYARKITTGIPIDNQVDAISLLEATLGDLTIIIEDKNAPIK